MKDQTEETVVQDAIDRTGFGKFNIKISMLGSLIYANTALNIISVGFILPAAVCDFKMTTIDKGRIAIAPVLGSIISTLFWGFLADLKGRRIALLFALFLQGNSEVLMSLISNYWGVIFFKFFSGVGLIGQLQILFPYIGEFQPVKYQKRILSIISFFLVCGLIVSPLLAWVIIPLEFEYRRNSFFFRSWNLFLLIGAIPAEILGIWLIFNPETPKYLAETGQTEKLMRVLINMYIENGGGSAEEYISNLSESQHPQMKKFINLAINNSTSKDEKLSKRRNLRQILTDFKNQGETAFKAPYLRKLIILCICFFCTASSFYSLLTWFPELFQRFASFEAQYPNETATICSISKKSNLMNVSLDDASMSFQCTEKINESVFKNSLLQGFASIIPSLLILVFVDKFGFKFFAVSFLGISIATTFSLYFANSYLQNVILSCIFLGFMASVASVMYSFLVILFPTNIRVFANTMAVFCSRAGTIFGNVIFTYLIDDYCTILIGSIILLLSVGAVLCLILRK